MRDISMISVGIVKLVFMVYMSTYIRAPERRGNRDNLGITGQISPFKHLL